MHLIYLCLLGTLNDNGIISQIGGELIRVLRYCVGDIRESIALSCHFMIENIKPDIQNDSTAPSYPYGVFNKLEWSL